MATESDLDSGSHPDDSDLETSTDDFESTHWNQEPTPGTPAITPGLFTSARRVNADGNPIVSKLAFGVHWNDSSYPAWTKRARCADSQSVVDTPSSILKNDERKHVCEEVSVTPVEVQQIALMFDHVRAVFGFQFDSEVNIFELLMSQLDSRASRSDPDLALRSLHADYIGGPRSNYKKWFFAAQMDLLDRAEDRRNFVLSAGQSDSSKRKREFVILRSDMNADTETLTERYQFRKVDISEGPESETGSCSEASEGFSASTLSFEDEEPTLSQSIKLWTNAMQCQSNEECMLDLIIYLMCWGEANQVRYMPECLDFIYKCARDYYLEASEALPEHYYLENVITPLYKCYRDFNFETVDGIYKKREADHQFVVGYDDMNQLFWYRESLEKLKASDKTLLALPRAQRFLALKDVDWPASFSKTYRETRSWFHTVVNFSRIWIIHGSVFWFYTAFNSSPLYTPGHDRDSDPQLHIQLSIAALGGAIGPLTSIIALIFELWFVPRKFPGAEPVIHRLLFAVAMLLLLLGPSVYTLGFCSWSTPENNASVISGFQFAFAILYTVYFGVKPLGSLLGARFGTSRRRFLANRYFTSNFQKLSTSDESISWMVVVTVFALKMLESYFFLTLSLKDPVLELSLLNLTDKCVGDIVFRSILCRTLPFLLLLGVVVTDMVLFFLDTYLWYVIVNTLVSIVISFYGGASVWTPWRNIYSRLPQRIKSKILTTTSEQALKMLWNSIIESMFEESLLTWDQARKLMYTLQRNRIGGGDNTVVEPAFFTSEEDRSLETSIFKSHCEAHRRISFFAQSLATPIPEPLSVQQMPAFTVLVPHYAEKIFLTLRETIRQDSESSKVTILEYLQRLHPTEWECFVKQSRDLAAQYRENVAHREPAPSSAEEPNSKVPFTLIGSDLENDNFDIPFKKLGFVTSLPVETNRVRMWGSKHTQTLYRTINGFMRYATAIKVLCFSENDAVRNAFMPKKDIIHLIDSLVHRKFRLLVAMQRFDSFTDHERKDVIALLQQFPALNLVFIEEIKGVDSQESAFYSTLLDGTCIENGTYTEPRLRVRISGNPILGDGKSDNQNHALIFYRGEYIQLVDSNQDHYLEECIKIRNVLMEFDERELPSNPYVEDDFSQPPVAIVGAREYIFSENIGVLGDVAAGKEQTFGTLFARTLAKIGSKLHYGHPDFLNGVFMTTRGGVSKAQKGLHLNEDIYAGMTALCRGGRIKHSEYVQCGKGRDLGFVSILNFTSKIGAGMGEQMLSREYFYLGTQLPIDRFLSFYYAHPGFHVNNLFIVVSLELFLSCLLMLASIRATSTLCKPDAVAAGVNLFQENCRNLLPLMLWVKRCVLSIFLVFFITLLPLFVQELAEKGLARSLSRIGSHLISLSMLFEIFVCRIFAISFFQDLTLGGAKYVATGRGFATSRTAFYELFAGYAPSSLYFGLRSFLILLYVTIVFWHPSLLWFWATTAALLFSPFLFNPQQFSRTEFFVDYGHLVKWFARLDGPKCWQAYTRSNSGKLSGYKTRAGSDGSYAVKPRFIKLLLCEMCASFFTMATVLVPYVYIGSQRVGRFQRDPTLNPLLRVAICAVGPLATNCVVLISAHLLSIILSLAVGRNERTLRSMGSVVATTVHIVGVFTQAAFMALLYLFEQGALPTTLLGYLVIYRIQNFVQTTLITCVVSRQRASSESSTPWWTGRWPVKKLGFMFIPVVLNEFLLKTLESTQFVTDFLLCHLILVAQVPFLLIPYVNRAHSMLLLWFDPTNDFPAPFHLARQRRHTAQKYFVLFVLTVTLIVGLLISPMVIPGFTRLAKYVDFIPGVVI